ncbi:MAG: class I mannose-6-phosphate isomerase [Candidatus Eisenbacteria sp.]|nr:class I mannose-6-phosphate isomerase [Candidatus Eisenbacteria bacterium]
MMTRDVYPLTFDPIYKDYVWGGERIRTVLGRDLPSGIYAESWEITDRREGTSIVNNGSQAGRSLRELAETLGARLVGTQARPGPFPLLVKIIDAKQPLSVQVHPSSESAALVGGEPKTEMWVALSGMVAGRVFAGLTEGVGRAAFETAIHEGALERVLNAIELEARDAVFVPGGQVHAIDAGCFLLEIQQNSDTTYRIYDWGRVGPGGKPRELHVDQALKVINWSDRSAQKIPRHDIRQAGGYTSWGICSCPDFTVERWILQEPLRCENDGRSFRILFVDSGTVTVESPGVSVELKPGTSCLLPAALREVSLTPSVGPPAGGRPHGLLGDVSDVSAGTAPDAAPGTAADASPGTAPDVSPAGTRGGTSTGAEMIAITL